MTIAPAKALHPSAALLRGFAVDFITAHDLTAVERIMRPDYRLHIGAHTLSGRDDEYLPPTAAQINQFPGLCVTVHDALYGENFIAMQFTEHGASSTDNGRAATWRGITLFRTDGERFEEGWAEEDYYARKRQIDTGKCDAVDPPHASPWDIPVQPADLETEAVARRWLLSANGAVEPLARVDWMSRVDATDPAPEQLYEIDTTRIDVLFSAGPRAAFHVTHRARYIGGFDDISSNLNAAPITVRQAGILSVEHGHVTQAKVTTDRLGLQRSLRYG